MQKGSLEHLFARADYYSGLVSKTTDPVYWPEEKLLEVLAVLRKAKEYREQYKRPLEMTETAAFKAMC